jgi:serine protease Do
MASSAASSTGADAVAVVKGTANSVVSINVVQNMTYGFGYWQVPRQVGSAGSGVIFSQDEEKIYILTNHHVIDRATGVTISIDDTKTAEAHYVGSDTKFDLAVISVTKAKLKEAGISDYSTAAFGDSGKLEVGERVVAIGNAYGEGKSATQGIISALHKQITNQDGSILDVLQTDAAINPGNSGGALVNASSQVIGINTAKLADYGVEGMGYSIPSNTAKTIVEQIMQNKTKKEAEFGIISGVSVNEAVRAANNLPATGVYVRQVASNSAAAISGIKSGDLIASFNGVKLTGGTSLTEAVAKTAPGDVVEVVIYRNSSQPTTIKATMREKSTGTNF